GPIGYECVLYKELGDLEKAHSSATECMAYAQKQDIAAWVAVGRIVKGLCECHSGGGTESVASVRQGVADWQGIYTFGLPQFHLDLAEACLVVEGVRKVLGLLTRGCTGPFNVKSGRSAPSFAEFGADSLRRAAAALWKRSRSVSAMRSISPAGNKRGPSNSGPLRAPHGC